MTFLENDSQDERHRKIVGFLIQGEPVMAALLAAADFEWTVRRAILALGSSPNADIRSYVLRRCSSLDGFKEAWRKKVKKRFGTGLPEVIARRGDFREAFDLRRRLVHGVSETTGRGYAEERVALIPQVSREVAEFTKLHEVDLFAHLSVRRGKGSPELHYQQLP